MTRHSSMLRQDRLSTLSSFGAGYAAPMRRREGRLSDRIAGGSLLNVAATPFAAMLAGLWFAVVAGCAAIEPTTVTSAQDAPGRHQRDEDQPPSDRWATAQFATDQLPADQLAEIRGKVLDRGRTPGLRLKAWRELSAHQNATKAVRDTAMTLLTAAGQPRALREQAGRWLLVHDPEHLRDHLRWNLHHLRDSAALGAVCQIIVQQHWRDLTPALIRSWSRPWRYVDDMARHEAEAIAALWPGRAVEAVVVQMIHGAESHPRRFVFQVAAWQLLCRLVGSGEALQQLTADVKANRPAETEANGDGSFDGGLAGIDLPRWLNRMHRQLNVIPVTRFEVLRLLEFERHEAGRFMQRAVRRVSKLTEAQRQGLAVRHLPVLAQVQADRLAWSREQLKRHIQQRLTGRRFVLKPKAVSGPGMTQTFEQAESELMWADLLTVALLLDAIDQPSVRARWLEQAQADHADTRTEYGGLLRLEAGRFQAELFVPVTQVHDLMFVPSAAMVQQEHAALGPYHFHVAQQSNHQFACPGDQDLVTATRLGQHGLVLTYVGPEQLNIDYYQPRRISVDLGTIGPGMEQR